MLAAALVTLLASSPQPPQGLPPRRPDVLVILADDLGWRDVAPSIPLPNLYALADQGMVFTRAYVHPYCSPTRYATMFGRYPFRIKLGTYIDVRDDQDVTTPLHHLSLATAMRMGGYRTLMAGKWHMSSEQLDALDEAPRLFGFETFRAGRLGNLGGNSDFFAWDRVDDGVRTWNTTYNTTAITDEAIAWWSEIRGRPRFAWVAYHAPHAPFHAAPADLLPPGYVVGPGIRGMYESMIVALDTEIGRLLSAVDLSRTIVFFLGDNGTPEPAVAADQDPTRVKASTFEGGIRVPFVVAGSGVPQGASSSALINSSDIFATLAELLGLSLQPLAARDSVSFLHVLADPSAPSHREWTYSQTFTPNGFAPKSRNSKCVVSATHKLMVEDGVERLFDLVADPDEAVPLNVNAPGNRATYLYLRDKLDRLADQGAP